GATGRLLVKMLLDAGHQVKVIVRSSESLGDELLAHAHLSLVQASILDLSDAAVLEHVDGCEVVVSCLGHRMSFVGMFGQPRQLVTDAIRNLCKAVIKSKPNQAVKFVLMGSSGVKNKDVLEKTSWAQQCVIGLLRLFLPPHADNENAAEYLRVEVGAEHPMISWVVVRPDGLVDEKQVSAYELHASPMRSAIFDAGQVSRINVARLMADLIEDEALWLVWQGQMPVVYSKK
ncbi:MAG: SDR family oxidoreductase, partial [Mariprofundaceae bacterium]|nr:SDR family oxidoreductase [Mariprofundaceae bacterium]